VLKNRGEHLPEFKGPKDLLLRLFSVPLYCSLVTSGWQMGIETHVLSRYYLTDRAATKGKVLDPTITDWSGTRHRSKIYHCHLGTGLTFCPLTNHFEDTKNMPWPGICSELLQLFENKWHVKFYKFGQWMSLGPCCNMNQYDFNDLYGEQTMIDGSVFGEFCEFLLW